MYMDRNHSTIISECDQMKEIGFTYEGNTIIYDVDYNVCKL